MEEKKYTGPKAIGKWISILHRQFHMELNNRLKEYDINGSQYIYLVQLYKTDRVSQEYLANTLFIDKSATARAIRQLEANGYVTREQNKEDKRSYNVCLTPKSFELQPVLYQMLDEWTEILTESLDGEQYDYVYDLLQQMAEDVVRKRE